MLRCICLRVAEWEKSWYPQKQERVRICVRTGPAKIQQGIIQRYWYFYCYAASCFMCRHITSTPRQSGRRMIIRAGYRSLHGSEDRDDDGVDDQSDILNGALAYVSTHPKYKSRYYKTGYPDDGYGVCTDVVAYALKNAGYDLQVLVNADIREQPQDYMVAEPDANIDFRRVRNLKVVFLHTRQLP